MSYDAVRSVDELELAVQTDDALTAKRLLEDAGCGALELAESAKKASARGLDQRYTGMVRYSIDASATPNKLTMDQVIFAEGVSKTPAILPMVTIALPNDCK